MRASFIQNFSSIALTVGLCLSASLAQATPVLLGSIDKSYGSAAGHVVAGNSGAGSCDTLGATSITVRDTASGCGRFNDAFDFSSFGAASIDSFTLTLDFGATNNTYLVIFREDWKVRPAAGSTGSEDRFDMKNVTGATTQSFSFDSTLDVFSSIVDAGVFSLWFAEGSVGPHQFNLSAARLEVYGTPATVVADPAQVPEPSSLALVGLALGAVGVGARRRRRA